MKEDFTRTTSELKVGDVVLYVGDLYQPSDANPKFGTRYSPVESPVKGIVSYISAFANVDWANGYSNSYDEYTLALADDILNKEITLYNGKKSTTQEAFFVEIKKEWRPNKEKKNYYEHKNKYYEKKDMVETWDTKKTVPQKACTYNKKYGWFEHKEANPAEPAIEILNYKRVPPISFSTFNDRRIGVELEYSNAMKLLNHVYYSVHYHGMWAVKLDGSLRGNYPFEFVSRPLKYDELEEVRSLVNTAIRCNVDLHERCGSHVHISASDFSYFDIVSLVNLCVSIEPELLNIVKENRWDNRFCRRITNLYQPLLKVRKEEEVEDAMDNFFDIGKKLEENSYGGAIFRKKIKEKDKPFYNGMRYYWLNISNYLNNQTTVEFRLGHAPHYGKRFVSFVKLLWAITEFAKQNSPETCALATIKDVVSTLPKKDQTDVNKLITNPNFKF